MKKKVLIKEAEIEDLVKSVIKEVEGSEQLSFDFEDEDVNSVVSLATDKYNEILNQLNETITNCPDLDSEECYETLDSIYENIFNTWKDLDKLVYTVGDNSNQENRVNEIIEDFNVLESDLVDYLEVYKEYKNLKSEFDKTKEVLMSKIKKGV